MTADELPLTGMPKRLYVASPSRLLSYLDCPRRYRMTYLQRPAPPPGPPWAHLSFGTSVHQALRGWYALPAADRTPSAAGSLVHTGWIREGYRDDAQSDVHRDRATAMVESYAEGVDPHDEPLGVERTVSLKTSTLAVTGRIDRLDERPSPDGRRELVVVDYKTGRQPPATDDARGSLALALYAVASERTLRRPCRTVELHHVPSGTVAAWTHTQSSLDRQVARAEDIASEIAPLDAAWKDGLVDRPGSWDAAFPPRPGPQCGWCDMARHCPEGRTASPPKASWAGLADPEVTS
jgi:putative RecB family exonuclease